MFTTSFANHMLREILIEYKSSNFEKLKELVIELKKRILEETIWKGEMSQDQYYMIITSMILFDMLDIETEKKLRIIIDLPTQVHDFEAQSKLDDF